MIFRAVVWAAFSVLGLEVVRCTLISSSSSDERHGSNYLARAYLAGAVALLLAALAHYEGVEQSGLKIHDAVIQKREILPANRLPRFWVVLSRSESAPIRLQGSGDYEKFQVGSTFSGMYDPNDHTIIQGEVYDPRRGVRNDYEGRDLLFCQALLVMSAFLVCKLLLDRANSSY